MARALIEAGADLDVKNNDEATALHAAAFLRRTEIVEAPLDKFATKYLRNNFGSTAAETVAEPFDAVKSIYDNFARNLCPLGFELDYRHIKATRPRIAEMLRPRKEELEAVDYAPLPGDDWDVSTPAEQGLDPMLVAEFYLDATGLSTSTWSWSLPRTRSTSSTMMSPGGTRERTSMWWASLSNPCRRGGPLLEALRHPCQLQTGDAAGVQVYGIGRLHDA